MTTVPIHTPVIIEMGLVVSHDQACAVCLVVKAVYDLNTMMFQPCWSCQREGWRTVKRRRWRRQRPLVKETRIMQPSYA